MNPLKLMKLIGLARKGEDLTKENAPMKVKLPQLLTLIVSLSATLGLPTLLTNWVHGHPAVYVAVVAVAIVLHALMPSMFAAPSAADTQATGLNSGPGTKVGMVLLAVLLLGGLSLHGQTAAPVVPAPAPVAAASSNGFAGSSYALAVDYKGAWSAGTLVQESFDFIDFGAGKANHLYVVGNEFVAPTPGFSLYTGGFRLEPNLGKLLAKTNVPAGSFGTFFEASVGSGIPSSGGSQVAWLVGGGAKVQITPALSWQSFQAQYGGTGAQRVAAISTGLSFIFTK